ncbi:VOC family protein [Parafilimonas terrae]|jgi:PhnB protein|uniref:PhnB protein n=1 Tax=Parafilimonas terrae TaxID=1465490 RepID=A0A1I5ZCY2_9BACT|nr:VOC family protein [Parafilimonas terrae]SFQ54300.1 PhnB protein [Parafilimonas terrae]
MATLTPYLNFYGKCTEAMNFYKGIFDGELSIQTAGASPAKDQMPAHLHNQVMHAHLKSSTIEIMGSDMAPTQPVEGNTVYLALTCKDEQEIKTLFEKFSQGGKIEQPLQQAFFGWFGSLEDKFGKHWMFNCPNQ